MISIDLFKFAFDNRRFVIFGFLAAFTSSFGQTYFIGIFGPELQSEFGLSHTSWGTVYMIGTLASSTLLPFSGKLIDHMPLRRYTFWVCVLLTIACGSTILITGTLTLILSIFLLRHAGQGLMSHIAITTMARYFHAGRGRAISIATLGYSVGEALLPFLAVVAIAAFGWRWAYGGVTLYLGLIGIPIFMKLQKNVGENLLEDPTPLIQPEGNNAQYQRSWSRTEVLGDPRIYLLLPGLLAGPIILTAMFFHHLTLADFKGWSSAWITGSYLVYAISTIVTALIAGQLIDRLRAVRLVPLMLIPLILAMIVVALFRNPFIVWLYMILLGINIGIAHTSVSAMWAELYGVNHLGAIRSLTTAISVFGTALGPLTMGSLIDWGLDIEQVCLIFAGYCVIGSCLMNAAFRKSST